MHKQQLTFNKIKKIGVISTYNKATKELNIVQWGEDSPKYDLRVWFNEVASKGITLTKEEMKILKELINSIDIEE